jgi:PPOX class probable F420-dependent enzyme
MGLLLYLILLAFLGLVVGALARLALPGPDPMTIIQTIGLGLAGNLTAGLVVWAIWGRGVPGIVLAVACSSVILYVIRRSRGGGLTRETIARAAVGRPVRRAGARECPMTEFPDSHRDLLDAKFASLATIGSAGFPQVTEIWFLHEDGELKISLNTSRRKTKNLVTRPQCSLFVLDLENPFRYLEVRGRARIESDDDYAFARRVGAKYDADLKVHDQPGETRVVVTIEPVNVYAVDMGG